VLATNSLARECRSLEEKRKNMKN